MSTTMTTVLPPPAPLRLTRRGRLALFASALATATLAVLSVTGGASEATRTPGSAESTRIVTVHEGDTLWGLAAALTDEGSDVREIMTRIERLNSLSSSMVYAGQRLRVPTD